MIFLAGCHIRTSVFLSEEPSETGNTSGGGAIETRPIVVSDLIGLTADRNVTEAVKNGSTLKSFFSLQRGGHILIVQSGMDVPNRELVDAFSQYYTVTTMTGRTRFSTQVVQDKDLRLYADAYGADTVIFIWDDTDMPNEDVKWRERSELWLRQFVVKSYSDHLKTFLHSVVIDVKTGNWDYIEAEEVSYETEFSSRKIENASAEQKLEILRKTYHDLAKNVGEKCR